MPASAGLNDVPDAAIDLRCRGALVDIVVTLDAAMDDAVRLIDQPVVEW